MTAAGRAADGVDGRRIVVFRAGAERFAVDAAEVEAVIDDVRPLPLPGFADHVAGALRHRGEWALALDVGPALDMAGAETMAAAVIVRHGGLRYALVADEVPVTRAVEAGGVERAGAGAGPDGEADRLPVLFDAEGPVTQIDPVELFDIVVPDGWEEDMTSPETSAASRPVVAFRVADQEFGLDVFQVHEVLPYDEPRSVPQAPDFVRGVLDLRDAVVPVVDMRARFDVEAAPPGEWTRVLVVSLGDERIGLIVDAVSEVLHLSEDSISPPPEYFRGLAEEYLDGLAHFDDRVLMLLRIDRVLTAEQRLALLGSELVDAEDADEDEASAGADGEEEASSD